MRGRILKNRAKCLCAALVLSVLFTACAGDKKESSSESGEAVEASSPAGESSVDSASSGDASSSADVKKSDEIPDVLSFSAASGVYDSEFELVINSKDAAYSEIRYTLDGSNPANSSTAAVFNGSVPIKDRKNEPNVVSAVSPDLFCTNYSTVNKKEKTVTCNVKAPEDSAVDKCTVVRAVAFDSAGNMSQEINAVYFFGSMEEHIKGLSESVKAAGKDLAVVSITMDFDDLFDSEKGIYVKGKIFENSLASYFSANKKISVDEARKLPANYNQKGKDWEREAGMTMLSVSGDGKVDTILSQKIGVRIQGNFSRSDLQKSFRMYARKEYGVKNFYYPVFGEDYLNDAGAVMDKYKTLMLRAGGNAAMGAKFNDTFWQSLCEDMSVDIQKSRPAVLYLNGEYWGLYVLQEDYSDNYFENLHGVNKDDVVLYKGDAEALKLGYKLDEGELPAGENESYYFNELLDFFKTHKDLNKQEDYDAFIKLVDPVSVMEYFAVEVWIDNKWDWPGKNWSMWKTVTSDGTDGYGDGRWRFVLYDIEFGGWSGAGDASHNTIKEDNYKPKGLLDMDTNNPAVLCFAYLMTNEGFRHAYEEKLESLSENEFAQDTAIAALDKFKATYSPLYPQFLKRYEYKDIQDPSRSIESIREFIKNRKKNVKKMVDYCEKVI